MFTVICYTVFYSKPTGSTVQNVKSVLILYNLQPDLGKSTILAQLVECIYIIDDRITLPDLLYR